MRTVYVINGPNLNMLGTRQPEIYGRETIVDIEAACRTLGAELDLVVRFHQSNAEADLIGWIQTARTEAVGIVINAAAYSHTSIAIRDALAACAIPIIEVHLSNVHAREPFRHHSHLSAVARAVIVGCGPQGYDFALMRLARLIAP